MQGRHSRRERAEQSPAGAGASGGRLCASWAPTKMRCRSPSPSLQPQTERMSVTCHHNMCVCARITLTRADSDTHAHSLTHTHTHTHWGVCRCDCERNCLLRLSDPSPELSVGISTWSQGRAHGPVLRPACQQALDKAASTQPFPVSPGLTHTHIQLRGRQESVWMLHVQVVPLPSRSTPHSSPPSRSTPWPHLLWP